MKKYLIVALAALLMASNASASRWALVSKDGVVENVIELEAQGNYVPPVGYSVVEDKTGKAEVGDGYKAGLFGGFSPAPQAPSSPKPATLTFSQFIDRLTPDEQTALVNSPDTKVKIFVIMISGARAINVSAPDVVTGMSSLVAAGVLTKARADAILAPE